MKRSAAVQMGLSPVGVCQYDDAILQPANGSTVQLVYYFENDTWLLLPV